MLLERIREQALPRLGRAVIERVSAGRIAVVLLSDGRLGVSAMLGPAPPADALRRLGGASAAAAVAGLCRESSQVERALALAVVNAAVDPAEIEGAAGSLPLPCPGDTVTVIGYITSVVDAVRGRAARLSVFDDGRSEGVLPRARQHECLAASDVVYVTGSAFANATIDEVVQTAVRARAVVIVGPSTPLYPRAFRGSPVTMLAGSRWDGADADAVLRFSQAGAGMHDLGAHMVKVWVPVPR